MIEPCCRRDNDGDGNCPIHERKGVYRPDLYGARLHIAEADARQKIGSVCLCTKNIPGVITHIEWKHGMARPLFHGVSFEGGGKWQSFNPKTIANNLQAYYQLI